MWLSRKTYNTLTSELEKTNIALTQVNTLMKQVISMNSNLEIKIKNLSPNEMPAYSTAEAAGIDLRAFLKESYILDPGKRKLIPTGLYMELPYGYEAQIRGRSGLAFKSGVTVLNSPGTIDSDYRGELGVLLINHSDKPLMINNGDRVAQMVVAKCIRASIVEVAEISDTVRGEGGFGHTGIQ